MAERRMFAKTIVLSDAFLDMPLSARCLYFTLGMVADDEGFVNSPKSIMRQIGATEDDLKILIAKSFLIVFEDGVVVIKHWRINNYLQRDRLSPTLYYEHRNALSLDEKKAYVIGENTSPALNVYTEAPPVYTQDSIDENSITYSKKENEKKERFSPPTAEEVDAYCKERNNGIDGQTFVDFYASKGWLVGKTPMRDWRAAVRTWESKREARPQTQRPQTAKPQVKPASRSNVAFANASWERLRAEMGLDNADEDNN